MLRTARKKRLWATFHKCYILHAIYSAFHQSNDQFAKIPLTCLLFQLSSRSQRGTYERRSVHERKRFASFRVQRNQRLLLSGRRGKGRSRCRKKGENCGWFHHDYWVIWKLTLAQDELVTKMRGVFDGATGVLEKTGIRSTVVSVPRGRSSWTIRRIVAPFSRVVQHGVWCHEENWEDREISRFKMNWTRSGIYLHGTDELPLLLYGTFVRPIPREQSSNTLIKTP